MALYEPNYATEYRNIANKGLSEEDYKDEIQKLEGRIRNEVVRDRKIHLAQIQRELVEKPINLQYLGIDVLQNKVVTNIKNYDDSKRNTYIQ